LPVGNGENFYSVLKAFYREIQCEWAGESKNIEDFERRGPQIVMILDNASIHKKKDILDKIEKEMPKIKLEFLLLTKQCPRLISDVKDSTA
jgi:hypothetical protein